MTHALNNLHDSMGNLAAYRIAHAMFRGIAMTPRFGQSVFYGGFFAFFIMCFYFGFGILATIFNHENVGAFVGQSIVVGFVLWFFFGFCFYELQGWIDERNKPREGSERPQDFDASRGVEDNRPADRHDGM